MSTDQAINTVVYEVHRIETAWGHAIEAEVLRGYSVVGQLALRIFDPWDGAIPFAEVEGKLIATVTGVGSPDPAYPWEYGIWVEGIALDHQTLTGPGSEGWLATRLIIDGAAVAGGSVPSVVGAPPA